MHNPSTILKPIAKSQQLKAIPTVVQKESAVIPLLTVEEKTTLDFLAKIFVTQIIANNERTN